MKSLFNEAAFAEINGRIEKLSADTQPQWGKMSSGQMMNHCQGPLNIILGKNDYGLKPNWLLKLFFKKSFYSDKLWGKNLPTVPALKIKEPKDFEKEKAALQELLNDFGSQRDKEDWGPHPAFGYFTKEQWGKMQYKHLDHHLRQFGV